MDFKRIFTSGAHVSGKTTLARAIGETIEGWSFQPTDVTSVIRELGFSLASLDEEEVGPHRLARTIIMQTEISLKIAELTQEEGKVYDRSLLDVVCYSRLYLKKLIPAIKSADMLQDYMGHIKVARENFGKLLLDSAVLICYPLNLGNADVKVDASKETASLNSREDFHKIILDEVRSHFGGASEHFLHLQPKSMEERLQDVREFITR